MKTNKLFLSLLCASVAAIFVAGCSKTSTEQLPDTRDTTYVDVTTEMLIPEFGLQSADVCQNVGEYSIYFKPGAAWTFTSETAWLEVVTASGTEADTVLTVNVTQKNESKDPRTATTTITVGGVAKTLTITQMGVTPTIKVFSRTIEFSTDVTEGWIYNIFTNCEIDVASTPEWVTGAEVIEVQKGYEYKVRLELTPEDYDSDDREGMIVLKDKASSFTTDVRILCSRFSADYYVEKASLDALEGHVISGGGDDATRSFTIVMNESPDVISGDVVMKYAFYIYKVNSSGGVQVGEAIDCAVEKMPAPRSAYGKAQYKITLPEYTYSDIDEEERPIGCFIYPEDVELNPQKDRPFLIIKQSLFVDVKKVTADDDAVLYAPLGAKSTSTMQFKVRTGVEPKIKFTDYTAEGFSAPANGVFPGAATVLTRVASDEEGWDLCTYQIKLSDEDKSLDFGTKNDWKEEKIPCTFWEHYFCLYTSAEYNPAQRIGVRFRMEKNVPNTIAGSPDRVEITSKDQAVTDIVISIFGSDEEPVLTLNKTEAYGHSDFPGDIQPSPTIEKVGVMTKYTFKLTFAPDEEFKMEPQFGNDYEFLNISCAGEEVDVIVNVHY